MSLLTLNDRSCYLYRMTSIQAAAGSGEVGLARLEPSDGEALRRFFYRLSPETIYRRFLSPLASPDQARPERLLDVEHHEREAVVGVVAGEIVGVARYFRQPGTDTADLAVVVADDWQRQGLATRLLRALADTAVAEGVHRFSVTIQGDNRPALNLLRRLSPGVKFAISYGVAEATVPVWTENLDRFQVLRSTRELAGCSDAEIRSLLLYVDEVTVPARRRLAAKGQPAMQFLIVGKGQLRALTADGGSHLLEAGDSFGWTAMWDRSASEATVVAESDARVLVMGHGQFRAVKAVLSRQR